MNRALFLDRDGVVNVDHGYVYTRNNFDFIPGIFELVRKSTELGFKNIIVTNQAGIARGYYSEIDFLNLMSWVRTEFEKKGGQIHAVYHCPHHPDFGLGILKQACECRKPLPGMLLRAISEHDVDPSRSALIGDKLTDALAGASAGVALNIIVSSIIDQTYPQFPTVGDIDSASKLIFG